MILATVEEAASLLRRGAIIAYPTETFYGLGALATRPDALARLAAAKLRPEGKPLPLIAADLEQVLAVAELTDVVARRLASRFWPGPLTLVLPAAAALETAVTGGVRTVGVRIPGSASARELARASGGAIVSTSANMAGEPAPSSVEALSPRLLARIDGALDGGPTPGGLPSTVVAVRDGVVRLVREGAIAWTAVALAAGRAQHPRSVAV